MDYILGISGKNSSTNVNIATISGSIIQSYTVGAINYYYANEEEISRNLAEIFMTAHMAGYSVANCRQVCAGIAGMQGADVSVRLVPVMRSVMQRCGYKGDAIIIGDDQIALAGALGRSRGAILIADDTTACYGQNRLGIQRRTGGLGIFGDDDGSAFAIGREILKAIGRANDGRGGATKLTMSVYKELGFTSALDFNRSLRGNALNCDEVCRLSRQLSSACQQSDKIALSILEKICCQLMDVVSPVIDRLRMQEETLAVAGKVLLNDAFVGICFKKKLNEKYPGLQCVPPRNDEAAGAVLLAKERLALRDGTRQAQ